MLLVYRFSHLVVMFAYGKLNPLRPGTKEVGVKGKSL
jgi:hypothetical protein